MSNGVSRSFGPYEFIAPLGAGGMGEVFRARDTRLNRAVAIKVLPRAFSSEADRLRRFEQEAKTLAALNHPNILTIYEAGVHESAPYLVSELLEGQTLRELLASAKGAALPLRKAVDYSLQIALGLAAAHSKGIVHRDLKPENIFITTDGRVKILDFGLAKLRSGNLKSEISDSRSAPDQTAPTLVQTTEPGLILGTPAYMSPEQVRGESSDQRSDIFSFGCVLFEMLTGARAFRRDTPVQSMNAILAEEPAGLGDSSLAIPPALMRIVERCLEKSAELRFQTASDLAFAIESAGAVSSASWNRVPTTSRTWHLSTRPFVLGAFAGLALAAGLFVLLNPKRALPSAAGPTPPGPVRKFELTLPGAADTDLQPAIAPDGRKLAYVNGEGLWLRWLDKFAPPVLLVPGDNIVFPFWSPLSTDIGYFTGSKLYRVSAAGGTALAVGAAPEEVLAAGGGAWLGQRIYFTTGASGLWQVGANGGNVTVALPPDDGERDFHDVSALPDRSGVLFVIHRSSGAVDNVAVWKPGGPRKVLLELPGSLVSRPVLASPGYVVFARQDEARGLWAFPFSTEKLARTGEPVRISDVGFEPSAASDGTLAYDLTGWSVLAPRQLIWVDRTGKLLDPIGSFMPGLSHQRISPDGRRVLATAGASLSGHALWIFNLAGGEALRFSALNRAERSGTWWPDGQSIVCVREHAAGEEHVVRVATDGSTAEQELFDGPGSLSPSGKFLFVSQRSAKGKMTRGYISLADPQRKLIPFPEMLQRNRAYRADLGPDDRHLAFASQESGQFEVYLTDFPGFTNTVMVSRGGGHHAEWHPNGTELFYFGGNGGRTLISRRLKSDGRLEEPVEVFKVPPSIETGQPWWPSLFTVAPDGQRFLMLRKEDDQHGPANAAKPNLRIVMNWFEELKDNP